MKSVLMLLGLSISSSVFAAAPTKVYDCADSANRYMRVYKSTTGALTARLKTYTTAEMSMTCERQNRGLHYKCRRGNYIVTLAKDGQGTPTVWMSLDGDFGPYDSGYLMSFSCRK